MQADGHASERDIVTVLAKVGDPDGLLWDHRDAEGAGRADANVARTIKSTGTGTWDVYDGDRLVARIVPHRVSGLMGVDLTGKQLTRQPYDTPHLVLEYLPAEL